MNTSSTSNLSTRLNALPTRTKEWVGTRTDRLPKNIRNLVVGRLVKTLTSEGKKPCTICEVEFWPDEFPTNSRGWMRGPCKDCDKARNASDKKFRYHTDPEYRAKCLESIKGRRRDPKKHADLKRAYRHQYPEKAAKASRRWHFKRRIKAALSRREFYNYRNQVEEILDAITNKTIEVPQVRNARFRIWLDYLLDRLRNGGSIIGDSDFDRPSSGRGNSLSNLEPIFEDGELAELARLEPNSKRWRSKSLR